MISKGIITITLIYWTLFLLMLPLRNLSYFDDFAYIQTVEKFIQTGNLKISDWAGTSLIFQVLWGSLFVKIFGFSIPILIFSNIILFYFGLIAFYLTLKNLSLSEFKATAITLFFLSYPWIFHFSYTFMSDIFYISLMCITIYFFTRGFINNMSIHYLLGSIFISLAFLTRQIAVSILLAVFIILIYQSIISKKLEIKKYIYSLIPALIIISLYYFWINKVGVPYAQYSFFTIGVKDEILTYLFPTNLKYTAISNRIYYEFLIQRVIGYISNTFVFLLPLFILYMFNPKAIAAFLKNHLKYICFSILVILFYIFSDYKNTFKYIQPPNTVIRYDNLFIDWAAWWDKLILLFLPLSLLLLAYILKQFIKLFIKRRNKNLKFKNIFISCLFILTTFLYLQQAGVHSPSNVKFQIIPDDIPKTLMIYSDSFFSALSSEIFNTVLKEVWFLAILYFLLLIIFILLITKYKLIIPHKINIPIFFISLILLIHFLITILLAYGYWDEYLIPFVPLTIILITYTLKNYSISKTRSLLILSFLILLSFNATRNRIQEEGVRWELATKLVESGVEPNRISEPTWSWRHYWYFEETFQQQVNEIGGNKYNIKRSNWAITPKVATEGALYKYIDIDPKIGISEIDNLVALSDKYWIIAKTKGGIIQHKQTGVIKYYP